MTVHVVPDWQDHDRRPMCWCQPVYENDPVGGRLWKHRAASDDPHIYPEDRDPALRADGRGWLVESGS